MTGTVLDHLYELITGKDGSRITGSIEDKKTGRRIGFRAELQLNAHEREMFVATGFSYLPDPPETIGVMEKLAKIGAAESRQILVYFDDRHLAEALVFHPQAFVAHGIEEAKQAERKERGERWLNLDRDWAVSLREFADGDGEPQVEPTKREQIERDGGWFSV